MGGLITGGVEGLTTGGVGELTTGGGGCGRVEGPGSSSSMRSTFSGAGATWPAIVGRGDAGLGLLSSLIRLESGSEGGWRSDLKI